MQRYTIYPPNPLDFGTNYKGYAIKFFVDISYSTKYLLQ